ncbi:hypothetical protein BKK47_07300 [Rodentibacter mrazii]|uniref:Integrating conjugative element membrane protein n=1 Tax=Rodentibacter mrazii TaxID=1908257 RepID=A0A1V3IEY2_9PAST|nr:DUF2976 domain-containing protein [Rodentibacter mrazii]OOF39169.1 hypothetical protein BKK47_07300 [Rodentibacter mrazii]
MHLIKPYFQTVSSHFSVLMTLLLLSVNNAVAAGGVHGIDTSKIPDFKIPGVDSNTNDPMQILFIVLKSGIALVAIVFIVWGGLSVARALIRTYNQATDENDKKGWGPFLLALMIGFVMIFFDVWLVKWVISLF